MPEYYQHLIYAQITLEVLLLLLLWLVWRKARGIKKNQDQKIHSKDVTGLGPLEEAWPKFLEEAEKLSRDFSKNLEEKKRLSADLILKLDRRIKEYQELLKETEEKIAKAQAAMPVKSPVNPAATMMSEGKANPAAPETRSLVLRLAEKGLSLEEIAIQAKLHKGEVELIIDLERQFDFGN